MTANWQQRNKSKRNPTSAALGAAAMNVSERSIYRAKRLARTGRQDLIEAVRRGELRLHTALTLAGCPDTPKLTPYERLVKAWNAASDDDRRRLLVEARRAKTLKRAS